ncbi:MAG: hypothetical protein NUV87_02155 [Candidatus Roizmanbacteria bacterium]|nr:hypothetical protein [Candidatus Roizmanbacteria bacterium]MCR4312694.1 hypothetical protein [Candidatus Roizmanbacteria bacterium]
MPTTLEGTSVKFKVVPGLGGITDLKNQPAQVMLVGLDKIKIGRVIPPGTVGKNGKAVRQLIVPTNLKTILDSYEAQDYIVPNQIKDAIKMIVQASY